MKINTHNYERENTFSADSCSSAMNICCVAWYTVQLHLIAKYKLFLSEWSSLLHDRNGKYGTSEKGNVI